MISCGEHLYKLDFVQIMLYGKNDISVRESIASRLLERALKFEWMADGSWIRILELFVNDYSEFYPRLYEQYHLAATTCWLKSIIGEEPKEEEELVLRPLPVLDTPTRTSERVRTAPKVFSPEKTTVTRKADQKKASKRKISTVIHNFVEKRPRITVPDKVTVDPVPIRSMENIRKSGRVKKASIWYDTNNYCT